MNTRMQSKVVMREMECEFMLWALEILQAVRSGGINPAMVDDFYRRAGSVFLDLADRAQRENRTQTALYYRRRGSDYRGDA